MREGPPSLCQTRWWMLIAIVLDRSLPEAQVLVDNPYGAFKRNHPSPSRSTDASDLEQMLQTIQDDTVKEASGASGAGGRKRVDDDQFQSVRNVKNTMGCPWLVHIS